MSKVYIERFSAQVLSADDVVKALEFLEWQRLVPKNARVFIKPNLTWPDPLPGVTTTPEAIEAVVAVLKEQTSNISIGESDGGYHSYQAEEAFQGHNLYQIGKRYGARIVNLSKDKSETITMTIAGRLMTFTLPHILLHETDVFITMPVPKTHVMTGVSLAFKNQWGCLPSPMRLREHHEFDRKILAINRALKTKLSILDGTYFLDGAGPMTGDTIRMNLLIASDDPGAASAVACSVMGIDPDTIRHFRLARKEGMFPASLDEVDMNQPLDSFQQQQFRMKRAALDWISLIGFRSKLFTNVFWESPLAGPLHKILFAVRRNPLAERFLYGRAGTPAEWKASDEHGIG